MEEISYKLEVYEGPLDLLLDLISKNKVDIRDIPISLIFDQYMEYIEAMKRSDMEIAGEFIRMAAELMLIKSRILLPVQNEEEEDPRAALAAALIEYKRAKEAADFLQKQYGTFSGRFTKDTDEIKTNNFLEDGGHSIDLLEKAFKKLLNRNIELSKIKDEPEKMLSGLFKSRVIPIPEKIISILRYLYRVECESFERIMLMQRSRSELIASFVAILELVKNQRVFVSEDSDDLILIINKERGINRHVTAASAT